MQMFYAGKIKFGHTELILTTAKFTQFHANISGYTVYAMWIHSYVRMQPFT